MSRNTERYDLNGLPPAVQLALGITPTPEPKRCSDCGAAVSCEGAADCPERISEAHKVSLVISGGQTGADQAGLAAAHVLGLKTGGMAPRGYRCDDGYQPWLKDKFGLIESSSSEYGPRTKVNVLQSDATVVFGNTNSPGSRLTVRLCKEAGKPCLVNPESPMVLRAWLIKHEVETLNVAGNRERTNPGIFDRTLAFLLKTLE